ncbi:hypothetical protein A1O3_01672 [Capronia epimyces CBS 606.96]|uniref:Tyrosine specific protein phosphatases domain-containing protein n=1 Tax=Capronia epimyces CBS 606.96 TaxID=1182542 RepID=W9YTV8_9EURO|nr:uncharacterized protein A1O3_01672 [Capronia epimyces CBS 606.96]EXJ93115.1 hypothetical protein A1O3_01672 [Capronia epimyces CBS 606.96]
MADPNPNPNPSVPSSDTPYQPYMDVKPPPGFSRSHPDGRPLTEADVEAQEASQKANRLATPEPKNFGVAFPDNLPTPPFVHVQGVPNFRELGGYRCQPPSSASDSAADGSPTSTYALRRGLLFRCAHPTHLTPTGAEYLTKTLNVHDVYDLRSLPEITRLAATVTNSGKDVYPLADPKTGCVDHYPGLTRHFTPVYQTEDYGPVALATKLAWYTTVHMHDEEVGFAYSEGFVKAYRDIATHGATQAYAVMFRHLLETPSDPLLFHCTAGKDRTGVFAALVLKLIGVDEDTICWEYALTEPGLGEWRSQFIDRMTQTGLGSGGGSNAPDRPQKIYIGKDRPGMTREEAALICGSRAGNMRAFLKTVLEAEFGGVEKYLVDKCGLNPDEVQRLRDSLIVKLPEDQVVTPSAIDGWTPDGGCVD